ncbi:oligosaccharide flippase family protein [Desulfothermus naphthae]
MKIIKNSCVYIGTEIINKAIPFLLLPIITQYLTPREYGIYGMYQVFLSFLSPFVRMSLDINITKNFFKVSKEELSKTISSLIIVLHLNVLLGMLGVFVISMFFDNPLGIPNETLYIMPIIIYAQTINLFNLTILRNEEKAIEYGIIQILITFLNFLITLILLIVFNEGWKSLIYGILIAQLFTMFFSFYSIGKKFSLFEGLYPLREIYSVSLPLIFHLLGGSIIFLSDRVFVQQIVGLKEVGFYAIGCQFGSITMILINAIIMAINPWMYRNLAKRVNISKAIYLLMIGFLFLGITVWLGSYLIFPLIVHSRYLSGRSIIFWISLAFVFRGWYQIFYNVVVSEGKTNIFMYITFSTSLLNLILNCFLIKLNGFVGAAQATFLSFLFMFFVTLFYVKKLSSSRYVFADKGGFYEVPKENSN